ncbi:DoxX family protein [Streptosporangium sp. NPDC000396]|uniref:DoxX family protein n=1 Tax=Streptosporangium sp. NPDC000396 TaxID=3366185 RepID=UPI0036BB516B
MRRLLYDLAALIARLALGVILLAHGWQKANTGFEAVAADFAGAGTPAPRLAAAFTMLTEFGAGSLIILGLLTPLAGAMIAAVMLGAFVFVHGRRGVFVTSGGFELVAALGSAALLLATAGAGRFSLDHLIFGRRRERRLRESETLGGYVPPIATQPPPAPAAEARQQPPIPSVPPAEGHPPSESRPTHGEDAGR